MKNNSQNLTYKDRLPLVILFLVIICLPDILTWVTLPEGMLFNGVFVNIDDANVYLSAIRQGTEGKWLFSPQFTPERAPEILSYIPYLLIGKIRSIFGGNLLIWFQILRLISGAFALFGLSNLTLEIFPDNQRLQKTSFVLLLFSSGVSWLLIGISEEIPSFAAELLTPEWNLVTSFLSAPHFLLGIGCQAMLYTLTIKLLKESNFKNLLYLLIVSTLLGLSYPFLIPINGLVLAVFFGVDSLVNNSVPWKKISSVLVATTPMILFLLYYGVYIPSNPELAAALISNNQITPPSMLGILMGFGLILLFALLSVKQFSTDPFSRLILIWLIINLASLYLPINFSGRFVLGLFIPICLLAAEGLEKVLLTKTRNLISISLDSQRRIFFLLTLPSTAIFLIWAVTGPQSNQDYPYYYSENDISAVQWLAERSTDEDLILADYPIGNLIPRYSNARVFLGHLNLTIDLAKKQEMIHKFWGRDTSLAWKLELINAWDVTYLYYGKFEKNYSDGLFRPPGKLVYDQDNIQIFSLKQE